MTRMLEGGVCLLNLSPPTRGRMCGEDLGCGGLVPNLLRRRFLLTETYSAPTQGFWEKIKRYWCFLSLCAIIID